MAAQKRKEIRVVQDQFGRPTSTTRLSQATKFLLDQNLPFGIYHVTDDGPLVSRYELAVFIYEYLQAPSNLVTPVTSSDIALQSTAPRPLNSDLGDQDGHLGTPVSWKLTVTSYMDMLLKQGLE
jgi:dTDP-4-dehydrorhamnose reductase